MENFEGLVLSETSFTFSWSPLSIAAHFTTGYQLECVPLLAGIPTPAALMLGPVATSANMTGLYHGVTYDCSISTLSDEGSSQPQMLTLTTHEIGIKKLFVANFYHLSLPQSLLVLQRCLRQLLVRDK